MLCSDTINNLGFNVKNSFKLMAILASAALVTTIQATEWDYSGDKGPANWAQLSAEFSMCNGSNQSPVNLAGFVDAELAPISFNYPAGSTDIINNGHTVQVNAKAGNSIIVDGVSFELKQFHFHVPSENHINGKSYPMEAHLVHADKDNHLAVVAVMFEAGKPNALLDKVWQQAPAIGEKATLATDLPATALLPSDRDYYRFNGSLTTPPCSEGVRWLVLKQPVTASNAQLKQLVHHIHHENNRPLQAVNARVILQ